MKRPNIFLIGSGGILGFMLLIALPFFCIGGWELWEVWQNNQTFDTAEGEVIHNKLITTQDPEDFTRESSTYHPVITFYTASGEKKTFTAGGGAYPAKYEIGDKVTILYDPDNPSDAEIKSWEMWFPPTLFMVIGILPFLIGGGIMLGIRILPNQQARQAANR